MKEDNKTLKEQIRILYDMEKSKQFMSKAIHSLDEEISKLGKEAYIDIPIKKEAEEEGEATFTFGCLGTILGAIIGGTFGCSFSEDFGTGFGGLLGGAIVLGLIGVFVGAASQSAKEETKQKELDKIYREEMEKYNKAIEKDDQRIIKENQEKERLISEKNSLIARKKEAQRKLNEFYDIVGIVEDFRNLGAIGYMYDIISKDIATKLEGPDGLNNMVRTNIREDMYHYDIINSMSEIKNISTSMYRELRDMSFKCDSMIDATIRSAQIASENNSLLSEIKSNSEISAYNSERIKLENEYQSFLLTWKK